MTSVVSAGPERSGSLHHLDRHRLTHQLLIGSPAVGRGQEHCSHRLAVHPVWGGHDLVSGLRCC